jgi:hypothetical protein
MGVFLHGYNPKKINCWLSKARCNKPTNKVSFAPLAKYCLWVPRFSF